MGAEETTEQPTAPRAPRATAAEIEAEHLRTLLWWALGSTAAGTLLWWSGSRAHRSGLAAFGRQNIMWGAVDGAIAGVGMLRQRRSRDPAPGTDAERARTLRRVLLGNAVLDVGYVAVGTALIAFRHRVARGTRYTAPQAAGDGTAIILQGGFLLVLDAVNGTRIGAAPVVGAPGAAAQKM